MRNLTRKKCLFAVKETQKSNKTFSTIARQLHCDRRTVSRIVAHFNETGLLNEGQRPGRPTSLTEGQQRSLDKYISKNPTATANQLSSVIYNKFNIRISERTLQRYRRDLGFFSTNTTNQSQTNTNSSRETSFICTSHLGPHVHKCRRYAAAQDKLRSHWTVSVRQWFDDNGLKLLDWPAHSPEFNAIEYVWHLLKETVKTAQPKSQAELEAVVDQACHLISQKVIQGCISHISTLLKEEASN
ncbi:unnamed protein product [Rotaria sp. Silwood1]|nr:unnamed protein product [Rotaria sp. Silwood1]CAF3729124.1 unnamed protein product [Rotaria sp. Silwood1]